jgi:hypothetical protein
VAKKKAEKRVCENCGVGKNETDYYNADPVFFPKKKLHICRDCAIQIAEENGHDGVLGLLRLLNKPFYQELYASTENLAYYVRMMNSMPQYKNVGFTDSDTLLHLKNAETIKRAKPKELTDEELKESEDFWGRGKTEEDYIWLNSEFSDYLNRYDVSSKTFEDLLVDICLTRLDIRKRREEGKDVDKQVKTMNELFASANIKPVQETGAQAADQESFGTMIKKFENERPIPDPDPRWTDVDGIRKYIYTFFIAPISKSFGKENPYKEITDPELEKYTVRPRTEDDE